MGGGGGKIPVQDMFISKGVQSHWEVLGESGGGGG